MPPKHHGLHVSQNKVELTEAAKRELAVEKNLVKFRVPHEEIASLETSLWGTVKHVDWRAMSEYRQKQMQENERVFDIAMYKGLMKLYTIYDEEMAKEKTEAKTLAKRVCICSRCFDDPNKALNLCIIGTGNLATSNIKQHNNSYHAGTPGPYLYRSTTATQNKTSNMKGSAAKSVGSQSSISRFARKLPTTKKEAQTLVKSCVYKCINDLGFPGVTVEKKVFRDLLHCVWENAPLLQARDLIMSTRTLTSLRVDSYMEYVHVVQTFARGIMAEYVYLCGKPVPCATICHDVWQGHKKDILGVVIMVADPRNCQMYKIPIGFIHVHAHDAALISDITLKLMHTFGFSSVYVNATVNDNTNSAILASKYISGTNEGGKCDMHRAELMIKHATGLATRSKDNQICDSNPSFVHVYKKFYGFASWLMSGHARSRIENLKAYSIQRNKVVVDIVIPNATRVAGCVLLIQFLIRNKFPMDEYCFRPFGGDAEFKKRYPTQEEWNQVAQFEGVLAPLQRFSISLQSDEPATGCAAVVQAYMSFYEVFLMKQQGVRCISLNGDNYTAEQTWDGSSTMQQLSSKRKLIPWNELKPPTQILVNRFLKEFRTYMLNKRDHDGEKALLGNPLTCVSMPALFLFIKFYKEADASNNNVSDNDRLKNLFVNDMVRRFRVMRNPAVDAAAGAGPFPTTVPIPVNAATSSPPADPAAAGSPPATTATASTMMAPAAVTAPAPAPVELGVGDIFKSFALKKKQEKVITSATAQGTTNQASEKEQLKKMLAECHDAYKKYISWCETEMDDWHSVICRYPSQRYHEHSKKWDPEARARFVENCENKNYLEVGLYFDVLAWWQENKTKFPKVFPSAIIALTKPPTNAFVERGFSGASHFDSNRLMRRQIAKNFEMRTMDAQTRALRERLMKSEKVLGDLATAKQSLLEEYNKSNVATEGEMVATKASTRSLMDLTTYWSRFNRAQMSGRPKVQSSIIKFVVDGSKQTTTRRRQQTTTASTANNDATLEIDDEEDEEVTCEVDDQVDLYTIGDADNVELVDLSYDSDNENTEMDEYEPEDNDVVLLQSLQDKLVEEETGVIQVDKHPPYYYDDRAGYVDMTADDDKEEDDEPLPFQQTPEQMLSRPIPSTPKQKDDGSMMSSASKRNKTTQDVPPRSYTPRKAKEVAAVNKKTKKKKAQPKRKAGGKKRKVDESYQSSEEDEEDEDTESEEE
jgi:hypothetical protein